MNPIPFDGIKDGRVMRNKEMEINEEKIRI